MNANQAIQETSGANSRTEGFVDPILNYGPDPDVPALQQEYQFAWTQDPNTYSRLVGAENVRFNRWYGQHPDGTRHADLQSPDDLPVRPWDRSSDCRVRLADKQVNWIVDMQVAAFWNARVQTSPVSASKLTATEAAEMRSMLSWIIHGALRERLIDEVELASQVANTLGWVVLHPTWQREQAQRLQKLTMEQIGEMARNAMVEGRGASVEGQAGTLAELLASLPGLIMNPDAVDEAAAALMQLVPTLKTPRARQVVRELREEGAASFPVPEIAINAPRLEVLIPGQDFFTPAETTEIQKQRCCFRRAFFNEAQLEAKVANEGWDPDFVAAVKHTAGLQSEAFVSEEANTDLNRRLIEIIYGYARQVDEDGVPGIWLTIFSPHVFPQNHTPFTDAQTSKLGARGTRPSSEQRLVGSQTSNGNAYALHELVDYAHGEYPFVPYRCEVTGRHPGDSRGVPEIVSTDQQDIKRHRDGLTNRAQIEVLPPLTKRGARASKLPPEIGPGGVINMGTTNEWQWFMPPLGNPQLSVELIERLEKDTDDYFGRIRPDLHPTPSQLRQQRLVNRWLLCNGQAFWQLTVLAYQFLSPEELTDLLGAPPTLTAERLARHRIVLWFDVRTLDNDYVMKLLEAINQFVLPADAAGVIDRAKLVQFAMAYLSPTLAEEVTMDQQAAAQSVFLKVRQDIQGMALGDEAIYVENDAAAPMKLQFAQQVLANNPNYQQLGQTNARFQLLLQKYMANLTQSAVQQQNKIVGRLGVAPQNMSSQGAGGR